jgi:hypothetical protein
MAAGARVEETIIVGWVSVENCFGVRVGQRWVPWAIGARARPWIGEYAEVEVDAEGYAVDVDVVAWRAVAPPLN